VEAACERGWKVSSHRGEREGSLESTTGAVGGRGGWQRGDKNERGESRG
jgi:hypothetical protein